MTKAASLTRPSYLLRLFLGAWRAARLAKDCATDRAARSEVTGTDTAKASDASANLARRHLHQQEKTRVKCVICGESEHRDADNMVERCEYHNIVIERNGAVHLRDLGAVYEGYTYA